MSKTRVPVLIATAAAGGVGYYLYSAGGSPKVAEKQFESALIPPLPFTRANIPSRQATPIVQLPKSEAKSVIPRTLKDARRVSS